jgi:hypothetical protein
MPVQLGVGPTGLEVVVSAASLRVVAGGDGDRLDERGLPGAVLADEESHLHVERQLVQAPNDRKAERIDIEARVLVPEQPHGEQERIVRAGRGRSPGHSANGR